MPLGITKKDGKFCVTDPAGKQFGCHPTKKQAIDQIAAIEESKKRQGKAMNDLVDKNGFNLIAVDRMRKLAQELNDADEALDSVTPPPIAIISDGTANGTILMLHGQVVPFSSMDIYCSRGDYASCSMSVTMRETGPDGLEVSRTMTLRKSEEIKAALAAMAANKLDPNAKVRNRGKVVFSADHSKVTDNQDHFPINSAAQARNALARVAQFSAAPKWWSGSLQQLQSAVRSAVSKAYPEIKVTK